VALDIDADRSHRRAQSDWSRYHSSRVLSSEALSQNIWRPVALSGFAIMALIVLLEWLIRKFIIRRRSRGAAISS
jgi:flagellar biogenesis protein FliO